MNEADIQKKAIFGFLLLLLSLPKCGQL